MDIVRGRGGWVRVRGATPALTIFVRFYAPGVIGEVFIGTDEPSGVTAGDLRHIPLAKIVTLAATRRDLWKAWTPEVDIWNEVEKLVPGEQWVKPREVSLEPPATRGLDDTFLQNVADAYTSAVAKGLHPNKELAQQVGHDKTRTVERWVYLARKRGFLPPAQKGAVG